MCPRMEHIDMFRKEISKKKQVNLLILAERCLSSQKKGLKSHQAILTNPIMVELAHLERFVAIKSN